MANGTLDVSPRQNALLAQLLAAPIQRAPARTPLGVVASGANDAANAFVSMMQDRRAAAKRQAVVDRLTGTVDQAMRPGGVQFAGPPSSVAGAAPDISARQGAYIKALLGSPETFSAGVSTLGKLLIDEEENEDFTLSPGQTRFRGGEAIASVPKEPEAITPFQRESLDIRKQQLEATQANTAATRAAKAAGEAREGSKTRFSQEDKLRDEFNKQSEDFVKIRDAFGRVQAAASDPSAAGDLALIFNYMKILDPGSTVREGEFATAQNAGSVPQRLRAQYNRALSGERLTDAIREDFVAQAENLYGSQAQQQQRLVEDYTNLATQNQLRPENVVRDLGRAVQRGGEGQAQPVVTDTSAFGDQTISTPNGEIVPGEVVRGADGKEYQNINGVMVEVR